MKEPDLFDDLNPEADRPQRDVSHAAWHDHAALLALLQRWVDRGWLRPLDRALVVFLHREVGDGHPLLLLAAALASHQLGRGHVCLDLAQTLAAPNLALSLPPEGDDLSDPPPLPSEILDGLHLDTWRAALTDPMLVGEANQSGNTPLVRWDTPGSTRLYLRRYWQYEQDIRHALHGRLTFEQPTPPIETLKQALDALFGEATTTHVHDDTQLDWQKLACALAARSRFSVITGGPGTGKTTTVVRLLALLQALQLGQQQGKGGDRPLRIRLAAPTGKAAARLNESIAKQVEGLSLLELATAASADGVDIRTLREAIPTEVTTLHRLLGSRPDTRHFRYNPSNRLTLDVLVVDEASMVDIEMMAALLGALPPRARLVLLGDKDQLASVEAGAVLGDLCQRAEAAHYTPETSDWLAQVAGATLPERYRSDHGQALDQAIAMLRVSHRFDASSGIGQLAQAVNRPLASDHQPKDKRRAVRGVFQQGYADIAHLRLSDSDDPALDRLVVDGNPGGFLNKGRGRAGRDGGLPSPTGYRHYLETLAKHRPPTDADLEHDRDAFDAWARAVIDAYGRFQLLCALRKGPWGVEGLNPRIARALRRQGLIHASDAELERGWYLGRPVLVTRNDYSLGLMNGDIGITLTLPLPGQPGKTMLRAAFPSNDGSGRIKWVLPSRLQAVETVFAMTVHKSQGSEFTHTALVLPDAPNPILTRELIYTGVTRAKDWFTLAESGRGILDEAVLREVTRVSGL